jgi:hypothetical protein
LRSAVKNRPTRCFDTLLRIRWPTPATSPPISPAPWKVRLDAPGPWGAISKRALPLPWPSVPAPETLMLQACGGALSDSAISPSNEPPTAATRSCISTL